MNKSVGKIFFLTVLLTFKAKPKNTGLGFRTRK